MGKLSGKVALITGAGRGLGRAYALHLAGLGADIVVNDLVLDSAKEFDEELTAETVMAECEAVGVRSIGIAADVTDRNAVERMFQEVKETFGRLDILVNNAGVTRNAYIMDLTEADWDRIHRVNAKGVFFCLQRVAREMIPRRSGRIINTASIAGKGFAGTSNAAYAASKGAVISLTYTAAQQLARHDINVNAICPGITRTPLVDAMLTQRAAERGISLEEAERAFTKDIPLGRANVPEDMAAMAVFLAGPGARNITFDELVAA